MYYDFIESHLTENVDDVPIVKEAKSMAEFYFTQAVTNGDMVTTMNKLANS